MAFDLGIFLKFLAEFD